MIGPVNRRTAGAQSAVLITGRCCAGHNGGVIHQGVGDRESNLDVCIANSVGRRYTGRTCRRFGGANKEKVGCSRSRNGCSSYSRLSFLAGKRSQGCLNFLGNARRKSLRETRQPREVLGSAAGTHKATQTPNDPARPSFHRHWLAIEASRVIGLGPDGNPAGFDGH